MFKTMKWMSIVVLMLAAFWRTFAKYDVVLEFVVCIGAAMIVSEAFKARKYVWASIFLVVAIAFNPIEPFTFSPGYTAWIDLTCVVMFLASLVAVRKMPTLSVQSVVSAVPRAQAL